MAAFSNITLCNLVDRYQRFRVSCCLHLPSNMKMEAVPPCSLVNR